MSRPSQRNADVVGLWGIERELTPAVAGGLLVNRSRGAWTATFGGATTALLRAPDSDWLMGDFGVGRLRLRPRPGESAPEAFWLQRPGVIVDAVYATPIALGRTGDETGDAFDGTVTALPDVLRLYVMIMETPDGHLTAFVREPNANIGGMMRELTVLRPRHPGGEHDAGGDALAFVRADGDVAMRATIVPEGLRLVLDGIDGIDGALHLTRRGRHDAPGFYPRGRTDPLRTVPTEAGDGWVVGSLGSAGLAAGPIEAMIRSIADATPTRWDAPAIQALLIARQGRLVVDEYFGGFTRETPHDIRSGGKSWSSTLAGVAVDRGELRLDSRLAPDDADVNKAAITLTHLLTMSSGLACDDEDDASPGNESTMQAQREQPDWHRYVLDLPMIAAPGERAIYTSGAINLVGAMLARTGEWLPARWHRDLAVPLGIERYFLNLMPNGQGYLAGGAYLRPRDFAKLAQVFLAGGTWNGLRVVSQAWVEQALTPQVGINAPDDYGYAWWRTTYHVDGTDYPAFYASGNGGQLAVGIPDLDLLVVFMAGNYNNALTWRRFVEHLIPTYVLPAVG